MNNLEIINVTSENVDEYGLGCTENKKHPGFEKKKIWMESQKENGLGLKILRENGKTIGFVEYIDGEHAWRGVEAKGYMFIHCIWIYGKNNLRKGHGSRLIEDCISDAGKSGKYGVAVLCSDASWLADHRLFKKNGFEIVDEFDKYKLMVRKLGDYPNPGIIKKEKHSSDNLKLTYAMQCPFYAKNIPEIQEVAKQKNVKLEVQEIKSSEDARNAPSPYGVFNLTYNGRILADYYTSKARFKNILKKEVQEK
jgi:RimJ/RimL family protein N-acetyltransferase